MEADKKAHYDFCKNTTLKAPKFIRPVYGLLVFTGVSVGKELFWDLLLGKGYPDWGDVWANWLGCWDAISKY